MQSKSLTHDHAMAIARAVLEIIAPCLREEEQREAFGLFYEACKTGLESYELHASRMLKRLRPCNN